MAESSCFGCLFYALLVVAFFTLITKPKRCDGAETFGFDVHHLFSEQVQSLLTANGFPEKGSINYYVAMANRDRLVRRRHLADSGGLAFLGGNETYRFDLLGYLHYANISVGNPSKWFLVALDTGSDLLWLPCDCLSCVSSLKTAYGDELKLNMYSPEASLTSMGIPCDSPMCKRGKCSAKRNICSYQVVYLSNGTSSTGTLVEDVLHFVSEDNKSRPVDARVTFGCGQVQTGTFLQGAAPNGLFGLGMSNISVPSALANTRLASNSFSMCSRADGIGRITFGDEGSSDQGKTPFTIDNPHPTYNVSITQVSVGGNLSDISFSAIFDSGTSFTYLNDPAYALISELFQSQAQGKRLQSDEDIPFEYCYDLGKNETKFRKPRVILTMKGGDQFNVTQPIVFLSSKDQHIYCLAISKSGDVNIIGQNFMTGYRIVFDREKMLLGWKESNCSEKVVGTSMLPISPGSSARPPFNFDPEATSGTGNSSQASPDHPLVSNSNRPSPYSPVSFLPIFAALILVRFSCIAAPTPTCRIT